MAPGNNEPLKVVQSWAGRGTGETVYRTEDGRVWIERMPCCNETAPPTTGVLVGGYILRTSPGMSVYVDNMAARFGRMIMCHMLGNTEAELHAMADRIGVARRWHQGDHYDICLAKRALAIAAGAIEITQRQAVEIRRKLRATPRTRQPGAPAPHRTPAPAPPPAAPGSSRRGAALQTSSTFPTLGTAGAPLRGNHLASAGRPVLRPKRPRRPVPCSGCLRARKELQPSSVFSTSRTTRRASGPCARSGARPLHSVVMPHENRPP